MSIATGSVRAEQFKINWLYRTYIAAITTLVTALAFTGFFTISGDKAVAAVEYGFEEVGATTTSISAIAGWNPDLEMWAVNENGSVVRLVRGVWSLIDGSRHWNAVSSGFDGTVVATDAEDRAHILVPGEGFVPMNATTTSISVRNANEIWAVNENDSLVVFKDNAWQLVEGSRAWSTVSAGYDGYVAAIDADGNDYIYREWFGWYHLSLAYEFTSIFVMDRQHIVAVGADGNVYTGYWSFQNGGRFGMVDSSREWKNITRNQSSLYATDVEDQLFKRAY